MSVRESARNEPGTLREYETVMILRPDLSDEDMASVNERIAGIIKKHGGKLLKVEAWGRRRLAYEIAKHPKGYYYYWRYLANNAVLDDLNHTLRMSEKVLRHMVVKLDENVHPDARPADVEPEALDPRLRRSRAAEEAAKAEAKTTEQPQAAGQPQPEASAQAAESQETAAPDASSDKPEGQETAGESTQEPKETEE